MEIWRDIIGYEGLYQVSNLGRVKRIEGSEWTSKCGGYYRKYPERILKCLPCKEGRYLRINLYKNRKLVSHLVHKLVLQSFDRLGEKGEIGMHLDNDGTNNNINNLKWGTNKENTAQQYREGRNPDRRGDKNPKVKYSEEDVKKIKILYNYDNFTVSEISKDLNKPYLFVYKVVNNLRWSHIIV